MAQFFIDWYQDDTLWNVGYSCYLSAKAKATFDRYTILKRKDVLDTEKNYLHASYDYVKVVKTYAFV